MGQAQRALLGNINDALAAMSSAQSAFDHPKTPPQLGSDPVNVFTAYCAIYLCCRAYVTIRCEGGAFCGLSFHPYMHPGSL